MTSDLSYIRQQGDNAALAQVLDAQRVATKTLEEVCKHRLDRHELQFASLPLLLHIGRRFHELARMDKKNAEGEKPNIDGVGDEAERTCSPSKIS